MRAVPLVLLAAALPACQPSAPPPHGEALVVVDTDVAVPDFASRLRLDLYAPDGTWYASRDIARPDPRDWPVSFAVSSDDDAHDKVALARVRAYPEGAVRDYLGERFDPGTFAPPAIATSLAQACASAPSLVLGQETTVAAGVHNFDEPYAQMGSDCMSASSSGTAVARLTVAAADDYRIEVVRVFPPDQLDTILYLRTTCTDGKSQVTCNDDISSTNLLSSITTRLAPGEYSVFVTTNGPAAPGEFVLRAAPSASWSAAPPPPSPAGDPRLLDGTGADVTPPTEPSPPTALDGLILLRVRPGVVGKTSLTLSGACAGTMAMLGADPTRPDPTTAAACVDTAFQRVPLQEATLDPNLSLPATSAQGTFAGNDACDGQPSGHGAICVPGGVLLLGGPTTPHTTFAFALPQRLARVSRFWMDGNEVTVGAYRAALAAGFAPPPPSVGAYPNDGPLATGVDASGTSTNCAFSTTPMGRESYAVTCIPWYTARAYCQYRGGDLPTEAQWEYAASAAGRASKTKYPWGDDPPDCGRAVYGRIAGSDCPDSPLGPQPIDVADGHDGKPADVTPLGIVAMAGGVDEWVRDSFRAYDSACWSAAGVDDPTCREDEAPARTVRGGSWQADIEELVTPNRDGLSPGKHVHLHDTTGFRCVYDHAP